MGTVGRHAAAASALLCMSHGHAQAQQQPEAPSDAAGPEATSDPTTDAAEQARGTVPIRVAYTAHGDCPDSNVFLARVMERTAVARIAEPGEIARTLVVSIRRDGNASAGQISLADRSGVTSTREVAAASCDQVVTALALVASVSIAEGAAASAAEVPPPAPTEPAPEPASAGTGTAPPSTRSTTEKADRTPVNPAPAEVATATGATIAVGADAELANAYGDLLLAPRVFGEVGFGWGPLSDAVVRLSFLYAANSVHVSGGDADFGWWLARVGLCPVGLGDAVKLRPCLGLEGALVHADSTHTGDHTAETRLWGAGLAFFRLQVRVSGTVWLEADGGATVAFVPYRFLFEQGGTDTTVRETPRLGGFGGLGVGVGLF